MAPYTVHFTDNNGPGAIFCADKDDCDEVIESLKDDPYCEDIWVEYYDEKEGWQV